MERPTGVVAFRALHHDDRILILPNVWDAASAALFTSAGAPAIATSSAGLAWSCGYADGDALPRASLLQAASSICAVVPDVPVTIDLESGYSRDTREVADLVVRLCAIGVAGINLEDGNDAPDLLAAKIVAVKEAVRRAGSDVFVNARTDVLLRELASGNDAVRETISRARQYATAGADGIFVPDLQDPEAIRAIVDAVDLPLNVLAVAGLAPAAELRALGVRRLSAGSSLAKLAYGAARAAARAFLRDGDSDTLLSAPSVGYAETNALLRGVD
ncbi:MAG: isocitrate lyase/phosphoenolpyruvate mutase family protein [Candidatus Tumulicola sp.]